MSSRAGHPVAAKAPRQGRSGLRPPRPLLRKRRPLTAGFPGKIGTYREDEGEWPTSTQQVRPASWPQRRGAVAATTTALDWCLSK
jgi:hypothetical protein